VEEEEEEVSECIRTVRERLLDKGLVSRRPAKKTLLSKKNTKYRVQFSRKYKNWTAEDC